MSHTDGTHVKVLNSLGESVIVIIRGVDALEDGGIAPYDKGAHILNLLRNTFVKEYEKLNGISKNDTTVYAKDFTGKEVLDWALSLIVGP